MRSSRTPFRAIAAAMSLAMTAGGVLATDARADAVETFQIDLYSIQVQAYDTGNVEGFNTSIDALTRRSLFSGSLAVTNDTSSYAWLSVDGTDSKQLQPVDVSFAGNIDISNGYIQGGDFEVQVRSADGIAFDSYSYKVDNVGEMAKAPGARGGYSLEGLTFDGNFSGSMFNTFDVSRWFDHQPLLGSFITFRFNPNVNGFDHNANMGIDILAAPLPAAVWGGLALMGGIGVIRARRRPRTK